MLPNKTRAQLKFAKIFSNNMVLQRDKEIKIWGQALPGSKIQIKKQSTIKHTITNSDSTWIVVFKAEKANSNPQTITAYSEKDSVAIHNLLIGDVWLCIGQSNMEWPMSKEAHFINEKQFANNSLLRWYNPTYAGKNTFNIAFSDSIKANLIAEKFYKGNWQQSDSISFKQMSAVAYYFGKEITTTLSIPIGLINLSIGGAPLESFISTEAFKKSPKFFNKLKENWVFNSFLPVWVRERGVQNLGKDNFAKNDLNGMNHAFKPGFAFDAGIRPLINLNIKGIICYQGESNAQEIERVHEYGDLMKLMLNDYRNIWRNEHLPFYFAQISSIDSINYKGQLWPLFRDVQRNFANATHHTGMAVTSDIGAKHDVHPTNKKLVGERLALLAFNKSYSKKRMDSGPSPMMAKQVNHTISIHFKNAEDGLLVSNGTTVDGFSIDGVNEIEASIHNNIIYIQSYAKPKYVYYGWQPYSIGNLVNKQLLPASTFKIAVK